MPQTTAPRPREVKIHFQSSMSLRRAKGINFLEPLNPCILYRDKCSLGCGKWGSDWCDGLTYNQVGFDPGSSCCVLSLSKS